MVRIVEDVAIDCGRRTGADASCIHGTKTVWRVWGEGTSLSILEAV